MIRKSPILHIVPSTGTPRSGMTGAINEAEQIERNAWADLMSAPGRDHARQLGTFIHQSGLCLVFGAREVDSLLFNRALGLDSSPEGTSAACATAQRRFLDHGIDRFLLHLYPQSCSHGVSEDLQRLGMTRYHRGWVQFIRNDAPLASQLSGPTVRPAHRVDGPRIAEILCQGFDVSPIAAPLWTSVIGRDDWHVYVACEGSRIIATGGLFTRGKVAYLAFAATHPDWRGRGAQRALMITRVRRALEIGCRSVVTETGEAVAGESNHSYRNMIRLGFRAIALRHNYGPAKLGWKRATS